MLDENAIARLSAGLITLAGGYLRNPVREERVTCLECTTPVDGYLYCYQCNDRRTRDGLADVTAILTYAVAGQQSGYVLRGYKAARPLEEHSTIVTLLVLLGLSIHAQCPATIVGEPITHWSSVPSLPAKSGEHPLHEIVGRFAPGTEVLLKAAFSAPNPRSLNPDHFTAEAALRDGGHVLLVDDTWATGGHAQSASVALRKAGAARVSLLVIGRWIKSDYRDNAKFLQELASRDYDPKICPWTGGNCPSLVLPAAV